MNINKGLLCFLILFSLSLGANANFTGKWEGKLAIRPNMALRLVLNVSNEDSGNYTVTMDSPDQGAYGIATNVIYMGTDSINIAVPMLKVNYTGSLSNDTITGIFSQGGLKMPLSLVRVDTSLKRPQTPVPPFPYTSAEIAFPSALDGQMLYGTITLPEGANHNTPFAIFISGSGTQNRDEEIFGHKPFAVIADYLARNGIAALRYDDRGYDVRLGIAPNQTSKENSLDALGAIKYLQNNGYNRIGLIGHSEGALIADMLGAKDDDNIIKFVVEIGGPAVAGDKILLYQNQIALNDEDIPEEVTSMYLTALKGVFDSQKEDVASTFIESEYEIFSDKWRNNPVVQTLAANIKKNLLSLPPWIKYYINYNPIDDIKKLKMPVFFIYGEKDTQVPAELNLPILNKEIPSANIKIYPELNHCMQHALTGRVSEYEKIEETFSPVVLQDIVDFILSSQQ